MQFGKEYEVAVEQVKVAGGCGQFRNASRASKMQCGKEYEVAVKC